MNKLNFSEADQFFKTIGEVSAEIGIPPHVLRFWEGKFFKIKPHKRKGGHRYYSKADIEIIYQIKKLLYDEGFTIKGAQKFLREKGNMQQNHLNEIQQNLFLEEKLAIAKSSDVSVQAPLESNKPLSQENIFNISKQTEEQLDPSTLRGLLTELESIKQILEKK